MDRDTSIKRRLSAILAADIAGYSRLMGQDEAATVNDLKGHQAVILPLVDQHSGRIIDTAGDGILAEFPSVIGATACAAEIQRVMAQRNEKVPEHRRMLFRIGINLGDVIYDETRIYGDGINVAARLEGLAEPGGVLVSQAVHDQVRDRLGLAFEDLGERELKNISRPVRVYRLKGFADLPSLQGGKPRATGVTPPQPPDDKTVRELPAPPGGDEARDAYLRAIIADCQAAWPVGFDPRAADSAHGVPGLGRIYVELDTEAQDDRPATKAGESRPWGALAALAAASRKRMVLLGLPGAGKTWFVLHLAHGMAQTLLERRNDVTGLLSDWPGKPLIPVIVPLGHLAASLEPGTTAVNADRIERYIEAELAADDWKRAYAQPLLKALRSDGGLVLFEGLDEVADLGVRPIIVRAIEEFANRHEDKSHILVTCREFSYTDPLTGWVAHVLAPLSEKKIQEFVEKWHAAFTEVYPSRKANYEQRRQALQAALGSDDRRLLSELATNPLTLGLMCAVNIHLGDRPVTRAHLYEQCVDLLFLRWESQRAPLDRGTQRRSLLEALGVNSRTLYPVLWEIAYRAHAVREEGTGPEAGRQGVLLTEETLRRVFSNHFGEDPTKVATFIDYCESANGLLMLKGLDAFPRPPDIARKVYAFRHPTFEEYLAARHLVGKPEIGCQVRRHVDKAHDHWREVAMFVGEHLCFVERDRLRMDEILAALATTRKTSAMNEADWRIVSLAGDLLALYRRVFSDRDPVHPKMTDRLRDQPLRDLIKTGALSLPERARAGRALAELGDPRFHSDHQLCLPDETLLGFVRIRAGSFPMGSDVHQDPDASSDEVPQRKVQLPTYYISRYPITVAQFRAFVKKSRYTPGEPDCLSGPENHPVVRVSWHEALAYCRWLTNMLHDSDWVPAAIRRLLRENGDRTWQVVLPSEAEWEKAARGPRGYRFPWGNEPNPDAANYFDSRVGATMAVGCFPKGSGYYGIHDVSGNVWEWTRSLWGQTADTPQWGYPYEPGGTRENLAAADEVFRVLRGGAYYSSERRVRCAVRAGRWPGRRDKGVGFRVALSSLTL